MQNCWEIMQELETTEVILKEYTTLRFLLSFPFASVFLHRSRLELWPFKA